MLGEFYESEKISLSDDEDGGGTSIAIYDR